MFQNVMAQTVPSWVTNADSFYDKSIYLAISGVGTSREMAERNALANIAGFFELSIDVELININEFQSVIRNNASDWIEKSYMENYIRTTSSIDLLLGVEVRETWHDARNNEFYALAVMEKARTAQVYREIIHSNMAVIAFLTTMNQTEKNSLDGVMRYHLAATAADNNETYGRIIRLLDEAPPEGIVSGTYYRLEAQNIMKAIPVRINVQNDRAGRIQGIFARIISSHGFLISGNNPRYEFNVNISLSPVQDFPDSRMEWVRISLDANFIDIITGTILLPYNFYDRRFGHITMAGAENLAFQNAENIINNGLTEQNMEIPGFSDYFSVFLSNFISE